MCVHDIMKYALRNFIMKHVLRTLFDLNYQMLCLIGWEMFIKKLVIIGILCYVHVYIIYIIYIVLVGFSSQQT